MVVWQSEEVCTAVLVHFVCRCRGGGSACASALAWCCSFATHLSFSCCFPFPIDRHSFDPGLHRTPFVSSPRSLARCLRSPSRSRSQAFANNKTAYQGYERGNWGVQSVAEILTKARGGFKGLGERDIGKSLRGIRNESGI